MPSGTNPEAAGARASLALSGLPGATEPSSARPFIKWAGGKTRLLSQLVPHVPQRFNNYFEPFLGGGATFFAVRGRARGTCILSDLNEELVNAWATVRDDPVGLSRRLAKYQAQDCENFFYAQREFTPRDPVDRAARFLYLNQTAWNGLWRVNRWGQFNVPWGQRPFRGFDDERLKRLSSALADVEIRATDFREVLNGARRADFVYLDPPYLPLSDTSKFFLYTERRFREPDLRELAGLCEELTKRRVQWVLSNRDTPLVRELFSHANIISLTTRRSVAAQNRRAVEAVDSPEVIVVGGRRAL